jgi:chromosome segregation ATPase
LLGHVVVGEDVTLDGVYREPGLMRAGADPRVAIDVRRRELRDRLSGLEPQVAKAGDASKRVQKAEARLADLRSHAPGATRPEETARLLESSRAAELAEAEKVAELELAANAADEQAAAVAVELESSLEAIGEHRAAAHHAELERARWRDRVEDLRRQLAAVNDDLSRLNAAAEERAARTRQAATAAEAAKNALPTLVAGADAARVALEMANLLFQL